MAGTGLGTGRGHGTDGPLGKEAVQRLLNRMRGNLTRQQLERLDKLAALIGADGRIGLEQALAAAAPPGGDDVQRQAAFRQFRRTVAEAAAQAGVPLALVPDSLKLAPEHRFCWFEGQDEDPVLGELEVMSEVNAQRRTSAGTEVPPRVSELQVTVHVCAAP